MAHFNTEKAGDAFWGSLSPSGKRYYEELLDTIDSLASSNGEGMVALYDWASTGSHAKSKSELVELLRPYYPPPKGKTTKVKKERPEIPFAPMRSVNSFGEPMRSINSADTEEYDMEEEPRQRFVVPPAPYRPNGSKKVRRAGRYYGGLGERTGTFGNLVKVAKPGRGKGSGSLSGPELRKLLKDYRAAKGNQHPFDFWVKTHYGNRFFSGRMTERKNQRYARPIWNIAKVAQKMLGNHAMREKYEYDFLNVVPKGANQITETDATNAMVHHQRRVDDNREHLKAYARAEYQRKNPEWVPGGKKGRKNNPKRAKLYW